MLIQITIDPSRGCGLMALCEALRRANMRIIGDIEQLDDLTLALCAVVNRASDVSGFCAALVDAELAEKVLVQRLDV